MKLVVLRGSGKRCMALIELRVSTKNASINFLINNQDDRR